MAMYSATVWVSTIHTVGVCGGRLVQMKDALFGEESGKLQFLKLPLLFFPLKRWRCMQACFPVPEAP